MHREGPNTEGGELDPKSKSKDVKRHNKDMANRYEKRWIRLDHRLGSWMFRIMRWYGICCNGQIYDGQLGAPVRWDTEKIYFCFALSMECNRPLSKITFFKDPR
jgi:hypothetical protein